MQIWGLDKDAKWQSTEGIQEQGRCAVASAGERAARTCRERVAKETRVSVSTLERWCDESLSSPALGRGWTAASRLNAVLTTAALDEASRNAWCRENGVYPQELGAWREATTQALADPEDVRATPGQTKADRRRIKELEREVRRKDRALAEMTALLVLDPDPRNSPVQK